MTVDSIMYARSVVRMEIGCHGVRGFIETRVDWAFLYLWPAKPMVLKPES